jgi:hypothetical protein
MRREFGLLILLASAIALWPAAAMAQSTISVINDWPLSSSETTYTNGTGAATDTVGNWSVPATVTTGTGGNGSLSSATSGNSAFGNGDTATLFSNEGGIYSTNNSTYPANAYFATTSAGGDTNLFSTNPGSGYWGMDWWFNTNTLPTASGNGEYMAVLNATNGHYLATDVQWDANTGNAVLFIGESACNCYFNNFGTGAGNGVQANTWYHVALAYLNGTFETFVGTAGQTPVNISNDIDTASSAPNHNLASYTYPLSGYSQQIRIGEEAGYYGFQGMIEDLRIWTTTSAFNVADTNPVATPTYHPGDANEDGRVDINDLTIVLAHYNQTGMVWTQGEFTGDGTVDINDLTIVLANYGWTGTYAGVMKAVPEPASLVLLGAGALALLAFVKRRRTQ